MANYTLLGAGTQGLTSGTARLLVDVVTFPAIPGAGRAAPTNYYDIGLLRLGVQGSYGPTLPIDAASMFIDLPQGVTTLGYSLFGSTSVRVTEVAQTSLANATRVHQFTQLNTPPDGTTHVIQSYTVPAGRMTRLDQVYLTVPVNITEPSYVQLNLGGTPMLLYYSPQGQPSTTYATMQLANPLTLFTGETLGAYGVNNFTSAQLFWAHWSGIEFDALDWTPS